MDSNFSIVTIVKSRVQQLSNLMQNLEQSTLQPKEVVIVWMAPPREESLITSDRFNIIHRFVTNEELPLPQARNKGINSCTTNDIIYLDVDCICHPSLFENVLNALRKKRVITTSLAYLDSVPEHGNYWSLNDVARRDFAADDMQSGECSFDEFNTKVFGICKSDFEAVGGFDEEYHGFGVGDVDFAARCEQGKLTLFKLPFTTLTQYRPHYELPVNHLLDIVRNANLYKKKWGRYPMENWLTTFAEKGLINADYHENGLNVRRIPTQEETFSYLHAQKSQPHEKKKLSA